MAYLYRRINTTTGLEEAVSSLTLKAYDEVVFEIDTVGGATEFPLTGIATLTLSGAVAVIRNGQDLNEGGFYDFTKDIVNNKIVTNYPMKQNSLVKIRVYGEKPDEVAFVVTAPGGATEFDLTGYMVLSAKNQLAVMRNGQDLTEGASSDFTSNVVTNKILFNYVVPQGSIIKIRA